jgi:hypothetical protein
VRRESTDAEMLPVIILHDEKATAKINGWGLRASCIPDSNKLNGRFGGDDVILVPDNSDAGYAYVNAVGAALSGRAKSIRVVRLEGCGEVTTWLHGAGTADELRAAIGEAVEWVPPPPDDDPKKRAEADAAEQQLIDELARLNLRDYDRRRSQAASDMGIRGSTLDSEVRARREQIENEMPEAPPAGHGIVEPWPEEVKGDALLASLVQCIKRYMVITDDQAVAIALWIVMTWAHGEAATHSPVLLITSAVPGEGKTQVLGLISFLARRGLAPGNDTPASIYQDADRWEPTLCIDEADDIFRSSMRSVINKSWTKNTAFVTKGTARGRTRRWSIWCPKAFGMIGRRMDASTIERCIIPVPLKGLK